MAGTASPDAVIAATLQRANSVLVTGYETQLLKILNEGEAFAAKRLSAAKRGSLRGRATEAQAAIYHAQMKVAVQYVEKRLVGLTDVQSLRALRSGIGHTVKLMTTLEKDFAGLAQPVKLDVTNIRDAVSDQLKPTMLQQHRTSMNRYGTAMVDDFTRVIRQGIMAGVSDAEMIQGLIHKAPPDLAERLSAAEPKWFPEPKAGFRQRQYWAERIVRTEKANAYNSANLASIHNMRGKFPDLQKKILATFDMRTAWDSVSVHGQIRPVNDYFRDGAGREYLRPPARPNDRETVIPWRTVWKERPGTAPVPQAEVKQVLPPPPPLQKPDKPPKVKARKKPTATRAAKVQRAMRAALQAKKARAKQRLVLPKPKPKPKPKLTPKNPEFHTKKLLASGKGYTEAEARQRGWGDAMVERARDLPVEESFQKLESIFSERAWMAPRGIHTMLNEKVMRTRGKIKKIGDLLDNATGEHEISAVRAFAAVSGHMGTITKRGKFKIGAKHNPDQKKAVAFYEGMADASLAVPTKDTHKFRRSKKRAAHSVWTDFKRTKVVKMDITYDAPDVLIHEMGHGMEALKAMKLEGVELEAALLKPDLKKRGRDRVQKGSSEWEGLQSSIDFRERRSEGALLKLRDMTGNKKHKYSEVARKAKKGKEYTSPYVGREYGLAASNEVFAMGIQSLYKNPIHFMRTDPEHFMLTLGQLRTRTNVAIQ